MAVADADESLLSHELVIFYPLTWVSPQWLNVDLSDGTSPIHTVNEDTLAQHRPTCSSRRCGAGRHGACCGLTPDGSTIC